MNRIGQWPLLRRAAVEHRPAVIALAALLLLNVAGYAFIVYPLSQRVSNVTSVTASAETDLADARREQAQAAGLVTGRAQATERLDRFYSDVLPANLISARLIAFARLQQLARQAGVRSERNNYQSVTEADHILTRVDIRMELTGTYESVRRFVHLLEQAPEFVVIENMRIIEEVDESGSLSARLDLATYYKGAAR